MLPSELLHIHREEVLGILARYPMISNVRIVGSVARGEDTENSDIDFLVDTASGTTLFDVGGLYHESFHPRSPAADAGHPPRPRPPGTGRRHLSRQGTRRPPAVAGRLQ